MSYENAPATKMLRTHCCACARPLLDAASVTAGLGPHCRAKHGVPNDLPEDVRERANKLIYECARVDVSADTLKAAVVELALLGCTKLADRISKRAGRIVLRVTEEGVDVAAPYSERFLRARGPGRWVRSERVTRYRHADAQAARTAVAAGFGEGALVRFEVGSDVAFLRADAGAIATALADLEGAAPKGPETPCTPRSEARWSGSPSRVPGGWGVTVAASEGSAPPAAGDLVRVRTRGGKEWTARLDARVKTSRWGEVWTTA